MPLELSAFVEYLSYSRSLRGPPPVLDAVGLWVGVLIGGLVLQEGFRHLWPTAYRRLDGIRIPGANRLWWTRPSFLIERVVPDVPDGYARYRREVWRLDDLARGWGVIGMVILDSAAIELLFRGVPFAVAAAVGQPPLLPVVLGSLVCALRRDFSTLPIALLFGAFFAWLWLAGAWDLAIGIKVCTGLFAHFLLRSELWRERGRYRATDEAV